MTQEYFFQHAKWVGAAKRTYEGFSVLRGRFTAYEGEQAQIAVIGLGFFHCYINGKCIDPDTFLPLSSEFSAGTDPDGETLSGHRMYVPQFDITPYIVAGENVIDIHYGGGWYTFSPRLFGLPKAIYCVTLTGREGVRYAVSDENCQIGKSVIDHYYFTTHEHRDLSLDLSTWENAVLTEAPDTDYCLTDCPADGVAALLSPKALGKGERGVIYDCGENTTGYPVLTLKTAKGERVTVLFAEEITKDGKLDMTHHHDQSFSVVSDGLGQRVQPEFTWFGFRYFEVIGEADVEHVKVIHAKVPVSSQFDSDNETLNWIYKTFVHTMLCNMHTGHPSDCPHIERRGYTGDGQLTCHAALSSLDAKAFYEKWLRDIADGQNVKDGHIQYTAPYLYSGGGPGGWGIAIVEVPYQLYRHYGDTSCLAEYYTAMRRYIDYLEEHSEYGLVTSDKPGVWCLGDWCGPNVLYPERDITFCDQQVFLPAAMVNTYFMVKALGRMKEIAKLIGREEDVIEYEKKMTYRKNAIRAAYFNAFDDNFVMNVQGANVFGIDLGLGTDKTYENTVNYYKKLGFYDTGIFATDILTRLLFEKGDGALAVSLLTGEGAQGFAHWKEMGATTFHEYWDSSRSRSHCHPMFGAVVAYFFEYLLGIGQKENTAGYSSLVISPVLVPQCNTMSGSMKIPSGQVFVAYEKQQDGVGFTVTVPEGVEAVFRLGDTERTLHAGENRFFVRQ